MSQPLQTVPTRRGQITKRKWADKNRMRERIENEVGDIYDIMADISKRMDLLERMSMLVTLDYLGARPLEQERKDKYIQILLAYVQELESGNLLTRADLEDEYELFNTLGQRFSQIANIVKEVRVSH